MPGDGSKRGHGEYRLRSGVTVTDTILVSTQPLLATRLNETAIETIDALESETFRSPMAVASELGRDAEPVVQLFERLHRRGFLEWRPARDCQFTPPVSIVVTVRNDRHSLERCLDTLAELEYPMYEVVVVDDGSTDGTNKMARNYGMVGPSRVHVLSVGSSTDPLGIGASRNRGVAAATYDVIAFTDADCRPRTDWLTDLVPILSTADLVGGRIRPAGETAASVYEGINSSLDMGAYASRVDPGGDVPYLATANLIGHRSAFESIPFPNRSIAEDVDVCRRAIAAGLEVVYSPTGVVEHVYRDGRYDFTNRRAAYGSSEALLSRDYGRDDTGSVGMPTLLPFAVIVGLFITFASAAVATATVGVMAISLSLLGSFRGWHLWQRYRQLPPIISVSDVLRSWVRERLSSTYAVSREITRYYAGPALFLGILAWGTGIRTVGGGILGATVTAIALPMAVEYHVHDPDTSLFDYGTYYAADHFGYQYGAYRGAFVYHTFSHLNPLTRFRLAGAGAKFFERLRIGRETSPTETLTIGTVTSRFNVNSSAEEWWFTDDQLRGERPVVADLLERIESDDTFLDVGANIGIYSCLVGRKLDDGTVIAVEPHPENAARLAENLSMNDIDSLVVRKALGSENGRGVLASPDNPVAGSGTHTLLTEQDVSTSTDQSLSTSVVTGDSLVASDERPQPTVIKIDVEGTEADVLDGMEEVLSDPSCRLVYCELHPEPLSKRGVATERATTVLHKKGFSVTRIQDLSDERTIVRAKKDTVRAEKTTSNAVGDVDSGDVE